MAGTNVGWSTLDVIPSVKNLRSELEKQTSNDFTAAGRKGGEKFGDAAGTAAGGRFKAKFGSLAKDAFAPIAGLVAGAAVIDLFKGAISGASDLAESGNKVKVIFGDATDQVDQFASRGAKAFGQTKLEVLNAASDFGVFGKAAGLSGDGLADFSEKLAGLSTDLASFFNTSPAQAVEAIGAGLRGESEPLRQFGVLLDDATLRQEALRLGLTKTTTQALTPQQRVLAAYNEILTQTKDAQGDFARTSGGLANQQRILSAQWSEMRTELGTGLLPAATATVKTFNDGVIPAIKGTGGVVADAAHAFGDLPPEVKLATAALVAFKVAQGAGLTTKAVQGLESLKTGAATTGQRIEWFQAAFANARGTVFEFGKEAGQQSGQVSRFSASVAGLRAASFGVGSALKSSLAFVGGPWGAAFIAGTAIMGHFWAQHQKAKQAVQEFTATLDKETGALTENSRASVVKALQDSGALDAARELGVNLKLVTDAALGMKPATQQLDGVLQGLGSSLVQARKDGMDPDELFAQSERINDLSDAVGGQNSVVSKSAQEWRNQNDAMGKTAAATGAATRATVDYSSALDQARKAVQDLLDKENERRNKNLGAFQDQTRIAQALADARKEAGDGARTLDADTEAGRKNRDSLASLADAWNSSANSVKNAKGAYADMRQNFIDVAEKMGASETQAKKLADRLLGLPKSKAIDITTPGMTQALADLREAHRLIKFGTVRINIESQAAKNKAALADRFAFGGKVGGPGTGDSRLILADPREWVMNPRASAYYGDDFMSRLNSMQVPRFAEGGRVGGVATSTAGSVVGHEIRGLLSWDRDGILGLRAVIRDEIAANDSRLAGARRGAGVGGVPQ